MIDIQKDGSERVSYDYDDYYAYIRRGLLSCYPNYSADSHWHDDLEFICVLSGSMKYNVNGEIMLLTAGNGIMVNARQLHYGFSDTQEECEFLCILLHPMLLCISQSMDRDFISPVLSADTLSYILLKADIPWQQEILHEIQIIYDRKSSPTAPLMIQSAFYHIWALIFEHMRGIRRVSAKRDRQLAVLKNMMTFIQKNYADKISLEEIAAAGNVSKSTCLSLFKKYLKDTPTNFLIRYRLKKAIPLLTKQETGISEIALETGFQSISYFTETFHRHFGCTPSDYRKSYCPNSSVPIRKGP